MTVPVWSTQGRGVATGACIVAAAAVLGVFACAHGSVPGPAPVASTAVDARIGLARDP